MPRIRLCIRWGAPSSVDSTFLFCLKNMAEKVACARASARDLTRGEYEQMSIGERTHCDARAWP